MSGVYLYPGHELWESLKVIFSLCFYKIRILMSLPGLTRAQTSVKGQFCGSGSPQMGWTDG